MEDLIESVTITMGNNQLKYINCGVCKCIHTDGNCDYIQLRKRFEMRPENTVGYRRIKNQKNKSKQV